MSIKYNGEIVAGRYKAQIIPQSDTLNSGIIKIATDIEVEQGTDNTTAITPLHLSNKQNKLIAGDNILIDENLIECEIYPDNTTIIQNNDNTFTTIAHKTKSGTIKIDWEGTNAEYESGLLDGSIHSDWYCYITDDEKFMDLEDYVNNDTLESSNIYKLGENKLSDTKGYNQLKSEYDNGENKIDILKPDNFNIVGSPFISEDGILSETSVNNYIYKNNINFNSNDYEITLKFTLPSSLLQNDFTLFFMNTGDTYSETMSFLRSWVSSVGQIRLSYTDGASEIISTELYNLEFGYTYIIKAGYDYINDQMYQKIFNDDGMLLTVKYIDMSNYADNFMTGNNTISIGYGINGGLQNVLLDLNTVKIQSNNENIYTSLLKIPYILSKQGSKIVDIKNKYRVIDWYNQNGETDYYIIDTNNKEFYLPLISNILTKLITKFSKSEIDEIIKDYLKYSDVNTILNWSAPDLTAGISVSSGYTAVSEGWIYCHLYSDTSKGSSTILIDNIPVAYLYQVAGNTRTGVLEVGNMVRIGKGQTITITGTASSSSSCIFYPCKGVK